MIALNSKAGSNLKAWSGSTEGDKTSMKVCQSWIDRREDGPAIASGKQKVSDGGHDANVRLGTNLLKRDINRGVADKIDDLGVFHRLPGCDVQGGHIPADIPVPDNRKNSGNRHGKPKLTAF